MRPNHWILAILLFSLDYSNLIQATNKKKKDPIEARNALACGSHVLNPGDSVTIESANYPNPYPANQDCLWDFTVTDSSSTITIDCPKIKLRRCHKSSITIDGTGPQETLCKQKSFTDTSISNTMEVHFTASKKGRKKGGGFTCTVTASESVPVVPPSSDCVCGKVNRAQKIVGGFETEVHEYPWQALLTFGSFPFCGGTVIANRWIITAAHCVVNINTPSKLNIVLGEHDWSETTDTTKTLVIPAVDIIVHPQYNDSTFDSDIALVELSTHISFNSENSIAPACFPTAGELYDDVNAVVTGWGTLTEGGSQPNKLYEVTVPTMSNSICPNTVTTNMICAGEPEGGKDSCQGDSGGPMVTSDLSGGSHYQVIGVVSWGYGCARPNSPGVYTRVTEFVPWIMDKIEGSEVCPTP